SESAVWRQIIADILEIPVVKPQIRECGAVGAAIIAGVGTKCYKSFDEAISQLVKIESISNSNDVENRYIANFERYSVLKNTMLA
ncbi:MAG: FGGY-family carbohydrate kinase, partial [Victivallaceae bacterium]